MQYIYVYNCVVVHHVEYEYGILYVFLTHDDLSYVNLLLQHMTCVFTLGRSMILN